MIMLGYFIFILFLHKHKAYPKRLLYGENEPAHDTTYNNRSFFPKRKRALCHVRIAKV